MIHHLDNCVDDYYSFEIRLSSCLGEPAPGTLTPPHWLWRCQDSPGRDCQHWSRLRSTSFLHVELVSVKTEPWSCGKHWCFMLKRSHDHRYTPVLDLAQLGARPPPDKTELVMLCPLFSGSEMILTFWSFLFEGRVAEESLEEREFQGRLRGYNQLNILVSAKIKPFRTTLAF